MRMLAGTEEECKKDLVTKALPPDEAAVLEVARTYLNIMAGVEPLDKANEIFDWESMKKESDDPDSKEMDLGAFIRNSKERLKNSKISKEMIEVYMNMLKVKIDGDTAVVCVSGTDEEPFHLKKVGGAWKIVKMKN